MNFEQRFTRVYLVTTSFPRAEMDSYTKLNIYVPLRSYKILYSARRHDVLTVYLILKRSTAGLSEAYDHKQQYIQLAFKWDMQFNMFSFYSHFTLRQNH